MKSPIKKTVKIEIDCSSRSALQQNIIAKKGRESYQQSLPNIKQAKLFPSQKRTQLPLTLTNLNL